MGCQSETFTHSKFRERRAHLTTIAFLPPQMKTGMAGAMFSPLGAPLPEEGKFRTELPALFTTAFQQRGFAVQEIPADAPCANAPNRVWDSRLTNILNTAYGSVGLKSVRPEAKVLADHVQADGLIFLQVFAYRSTEGRKVEVVLVNTLSILAAAGGKYGPGSSFSQAIVQIALVDGQTGDVLWRTVHDFTDLPKTCPDRVVAELLKRFPKH